MHHKIVCVRGLEGGGGVAIEYYGKFSAEYLNTFIVAGGGDMTGWPKERKRHPSSSRKR